MMTPQAMPSNQSLEVRYAHLCDYALISNESKLSIIGLFENTFALSYPTQHPMMFLVFMLEMSSAMLASELHIIIKYDDSDGKVLAQMESKFRVNGSGGPSVRPTVPQIIPLAGLPIPKPGTYRFSIWGNSRLLYELTFEATLAPQVAG